MPHRSSTSCVTLAARLCVSCWLAAGVALTARVANGQLATYENPPINYHDTTVADPVAVLAEKVESGELELEHEPRLGYLASVLELLEIPVSSQVLVFSKTSMQASRISPRRPRAIYFNDDTYVGWCQFGDVIELAATDARQGATFYTLDQSKGGTPRFTRDRGNCLSCHANSRTRGIPGYVVRSVYPSRSGQPNYGSGSFTTTDSSPFSERWGGWYVTGTHGRMRHMGNILFERDDQQGDRESGANRRSLDRWIQTDRYLSPHSDLIALMVLEHQTQMHNEIAAANYVTREAIYRSHQMNELLEREPGHVTDSAIRQIDQAADRVVERLLMCNEFELESPVEGTSDFASEFTERGKRDSRGRSLRDLDLKKRLFRYPCSYLIHSAAFLELPDPVRSRIVERLENVLTGQDQSPQFSHLSSKTRREIREVLRDTHPELFN